MKPIKLGIIGAGRFVQRRILPALENVGDFEPIALYSPNSREQVARKFHLPIVAKSREECIHHPDVEALFIATPHHCHEEDAIACAVAHKPTLCEKPLAPTVAAMLRMKEAFQKSGTCLLVGHSMRFLPSIERARKLYREGELGELRSICFHYSMQTDRSNWRFKKECGGGILLDVGVHLIDALRFITGEEIVSSYALADTVEGCDISVKAIGRLTKGAQWSIDCSMDQLFRTGFEVIGSKARVVCNDALVQKKEKPGKLTLVREDDSSQEYLLPFEDIYEKELLHFTAVLKGETTPLIGACEGIRNGEVVEALHQSIAQEKVDFPF